MTSTTLVVLSGLLAAKSAFADPAAPESAAATATTGQDDAGPARELHTEGLARFRSTDYAGAVERFRQAYERKPLPGFLYNIAQAERLRGHCSAAVTAYRDFLETGPTGPFRELAEARLTELEPCPKAPSTEQQEAPETPGGEQAVPAPTAASKPRKPRTPAAEPRPKSRSSAVASVVSFGGAAAFLTLSGYFAWRAGRTSDRVTTRFAETGRTWDGAAASDERAGKRDEALAIVGLAGGILATGVGVWTLTFD